VITGVGASAAGDSVATSGPRALSRGGEAVRSGAGDCWGEPGLAAPSAASPAKVAGRPFGGASALGDCRNGDREDCGNARRGGLDGGGITGAGIDGTWSGLPSTVPLAVEAGRGGDAGEGAAGEVGPASGPDPGSGRDGDAGGASGERSEPVMLAAEGKAGGGMARGAGGMTAGDAEAEETSAGEVARVHTGGTIVSAAAVAQAESVSAAGGACRLSHVAGVVLSAAVLSVAFAAGASGGDGAELAATGTSSTEKPALAGEGGAESDGDVRASLVAP